MRRISIALSLPVVVSFCLVPQWTWAAPPDGGEEAPAAEPAADDAAPLTEDEVAELTQRGIEAYNDEQDYATAARIFKQVFENEIGRAHV